MKKIDLARQYCLTGTPSNALHKLNRYIRDVKGLKEALTVMVITRKIAPSRRSKYRYSMIF
jgi:hypothetical protein